MEQEEHAEAAGDALAHAADVNPADLHGAAEIEHAATGMPQLDITTYPNMIFWLVVTLVLIYLLLTRVALPRIARALEERSDAITTDLEQAALLKRRADEAEAAYNAALARARDEAHRIAADAKADVAKELQVLTAKAEAEIAARTAESEGRIREIRDGAVASVEEVARNAAKDIVDLFLPGAGEEGAVGDAVSGRLRG
jgi:F-type H+-transporting ATPase subunit b